MNRVRNDASGPMVQNRKDGPPDRIGGSNGTINGGVCLDQQRRGRLGTVGDAAGKVFDSLSSAQASLSGSSGRPDGVGRPQITGGPDGVVTTQDHGRGGGMMQMLRGLLQLMGPLMQMMGQQMIEQNRAGSAGGPLAHHGAQIGGHVDSVGGNNKPNNLTGLNNAGRSFMDKLGQTLQSLQQLMIGAELNQMGAQLGHMGVRRDKLPRAQTEVSPSPHTRQVGVPQQQIEQRPQLSVTQLVFNA